MSTLNMKVSGSFEMLVIPYTTSQPSRPQSNAQLSLQFFRAVCNGTCRVVRSAMQAVFYPTGLPAGESDGASLRVSVGRATVT
jgi:hypothetical protein